MKKITKNVLGRDVIIAYNLATQIAYEQLTDSPLEPDDFKSTKNIVLLIMACIIANNSDVEISLEELTHKLTGEEFIDLAKVVLELYAEWNHIPSVAATDSTVVSKDDEQTTETKKKE